MKTENFITPVSQFLNRETNTRSQNCGLGPHGRRPVRGDPGTWDTRLVGSTELVELEPMGPACEPNILRKGGVAVPSIHRIGITGRAVAMHGLVDTSFEQVGAVGVLDSGTKRHGEARPAKSIIADGEKILRRHAFPARTEGRTNSVLAHNRNEETSFNEVLI